MKNLKTNSTAQLKGNYQRVLDTEDGEVVLEHLKMCFGFYQTTHVKNDAYETAFYEGQRSVVLHLLKMQNNDTVELKQQEGYIDE